MLSVSKRPVVCFSDKAVDAKPAVKTGANADAPAPKAKKAVKKNALGRLKAYNKFEASKPEAGSWQIRFSYQPPNGFGT